MLAWDWHAFIDGGDELHLQDQGWVRVVDSQVQGSPLRDTGDAQPVLVCESSESSLQLSSQRVLSSIRGCAVADSNGDQEQGPEDEARVHRSSASQDAVDRARAEGAEPGEASPSLSRSHSQACSPSSSCKLEALQQGRPDGVVREPGIAMYGLDADYKEYIGWSRGGLIVEIERYETEVLESGVYFIEEQEETPLCAKCAVKMVKRVNRLDQSEFWGVPNVSSMQADAGAELCRSGGGSGATESIQGEDDGQGAELRQQGKGGFLEWL